MNAFLWAILLLLIGLALMAMELFVPFAGILGILSALVIFLSVVTVFYYEGLGPGTLYLLAVAFVVGLALVKGLHWWPHTKLGKLILNLPPDRRDPDLETSLAPLDFLIGRIGLTKSKMRPSGVILVDGENYDAVSTGGPLEEGDPVQVVDVQGNRILIRPHEVTLPTTTSAPRHDPPDDRGRDPDRSDSGAPADGDTTESPANVDLLFPDPFDESSTDPRLP